MPGTLLPRLVLSSLLLSACGGSPEPEVARNDAGGGPFAGSSPGGSSGSAGSGAASSGGTSGTGGTHTAGSGGTGGTGGSHAGGTSGTGGTHTAGSGGAGGSGSFDCAPPAPSVDASSGGSFHAPWRPTLPDERYALGWSCGTYTDGSRPVLQSVFRLVLTETRDVRVTVHDAAHADVALFGSCEPPGGAWLGCTPSVGGATLDSTGTFRAVPPGAYVLAGQWEAWPGVPDPAEDLAIDVEFSVPTFPPGNDQCGAALDLGRGGSFPGTLDGARIDYPAPLCSSARYADVAYRFTLDAPSDVELVVGGGHLLTLADDCASPRVPHRGCGTGWVTASDLPAGTYYVLVGNAHGVTSPGPDDFTLEARIEPARTPPGDTCSTAVRIPLGVPQEGDLFGGSDSLHAPPWVLGSPLYCRSAGYEGRTDAFFELDLPSRRHLHVELSAESATNLSLARDCADFSTPGTELACTAGGLGGSGQLSVRDLAAGRYLLRLQTSNLSSKPPGPYTLTVNADVPDATCAAPRATLTGSGSSELVGTTAASFDDHRGCGALATSGHDVVYVLSLTARSRVSVDASATPGGVAYVRATCADEGSERLCAAPTGAATLDPGTYYVVVDSTKSGAADYHVFVDRVSL